MHSHTALPTIFAILYCRVSSKKQKTEGSGLETQEHRCRTHAEERAATRSKPSFRMM
jgi:DNA invertase Pin-like site-specific DNA recombinase